MGTCTCWATTMVIEVMMNEDERATSDILLELLGRESDESCEEGNVCLANDVARLFDRKDEEIARFKRQLRETEEVAHHLDKALRTHIDVFNGLDHHQDECPGLRIGLNQPCLGCAANNVVDAALKLYAVHCAERSGDAAARKDAGAEQKSSAVFSSPERSVSKKDVEQIVRQAILEERAYLRAALREVYGRFDRIDGTVALEQLCRVLEDQEEIR